MSESLQMDDVAGSLLQFLEDVGDAPEILWAAALAIVARGLREAEEARHGRFRHNPNGQVRRLRAEMARGLKLARLAAAVQEEQSVRESTLDADLVARAAAAAKELRRAQTLPAQLARLENARRRKAGLPLSNRILSQEWQQAAAEAHR